MPEDLDHQLPGEGEGNPEDASAAFDDLPPDGWDHGPSAEEGGAVHPDETGRHADEGSADDAADAFGEPEDLDVPRPFGGKVHSPSAPTPRRRVAPGLPAGDLPAGTGEGWGPSGDFETVERVQVAKGDTGPTLEVVPAQRALEQGLRFLAIGAAPSQHFAKDGLGAELLRQVGGDLQGIPPGNAVRRDPHDAAKRTPEVAVEPPTIVEKAPILPPRFSLDAVDDLLPAAPPAPRAAFAPPARPVPADGQGVAQAEAASWPYDPVMERGSGAAGTGWEQAAGTGDAAGASLGSDGPESQAGLRFHPPGGSDAPQSGWPGVRAPGAPQGPSVPLGAPAVPLKAPRASQGPSRFGLGHLLVAAAAAAVVAFVLARLAPPAVPVADPVAAYALGERDQAVTYLDQQIAQLERDLAGREKAMQDAIRAMGSSPTPAQLAEVEALGRDRNRLTITLEALRRRRERMVSGGIHG